MNGFPNWVNSSVLGGFDGPLCFGFDSRRGHVTNNKEPTEHEILQANLKAAKQSLISTMEAYGIRPEQAVVQVQAVIDAARKLAELELY